MAGEPRKRRLNRVRSQPIGEDGMKAKAIALLGLALPMAAFAGYKD